MPLDGRWSCRVPLVVPLIDDRGLPVVAIVDSRCPRERTALRTVPGQPAVYRIQSYFDTSRYFCRRQPVVIVTDLWQDWDRVVDRLLSASWISSCAKYSSQGKGVRRGEFKADRSRRPGRLLLAMTPRGLGYVDVPPQSGYIGIVGQCGLKLTVRHAAHSFNTAISGASVQGRARPERYIAVVKLQGPERYGW
jgi:hypothetical protein